MVLSLRPAGTLASKKATADSVQILDFKMERLLQYCIAGVDKAAGWLGGEVHPDSPPHRSQQPGGLG